MTMRKFPGASYDAWKTTEDEERWWQGDPADNLIEQGEDVMMVRELWHDSINEDRIVEAVERRFRTLDDPGFCLACGHEQGNCEPDARRYRCESCGQREVYGADELLQRIAP